MHFLVAECAHRAAGWGAEQCTLRASRHSCRAERAGLSSAPFRRQLLCYPFRMAYYLMHSLTSATSSLRRAVLAYGLSFSSAPRFFSGFFFSGRCVRVRVCGDRSGEVRH